MPLLCAGSPIMPCDGNCPAGVISRMPPAPISRLACVPAALAHLFLALAFTLFARASTPELITKAVQIWELPQAEKQVPHPIRIEARVNFVDPSWGLLWLEDKGVSTYVQLARNAPRFVAGQRVLIEGEIVPIQGLSASSVRVTVLRDFEPATPLASEGRINDFAALDSRIVAIKHAYVDRLQLVDGGHLRLNLAVEDRMIVGWVKPTDPARLPDWQGKVVSFTGLYSARMDPTKTKATIEVWICGEDAVSVVGDLDSLPSFRLPITPIAELPHAPNHSYQHVSGIVTESDPGRHIRVRDASGQVDVETVLLSPVPEGTRVEAAGRVEHGQGQWRLSEALFKVVRASDGVHRRQGDGEALASVAAIRALDLAEAEKGRRVAISGVVTWSLPDSDTFYLQDVTGGIRIHFDRKSLPSPPLCKALAIEGVTLGGTPPSVELRSFVDLGAMNAPTPRRIGLSRALMGYEDGQWVEIQGFVRMVESMGDWRRIYVTSPAGEFIGLMQSPVNFVANPGSLIRVQGVCETRSDKSGRVTEVVLLVPFIHSIIVEEDAPADFFDLPQCPVSNLGALAAQSDVRRVRVSGVVTRSVPGDSLTVQEGGMGVLLLTRGAEHLGLGDRIDAVGILGTEGQRTLLRDAVVRRLGKGEPPQPVGVNDPSRLSRRLDQRLVSVQGRLIDVFRSQAQMRLRLQSGSTFFEALMEGTDRMPERTPDLGAKLRLAGVYSCDFDDARRLTGFHLNLRDAADIAVVEGARFWTLKRAMTVALVMAAIALLSIGWVTALRRKVREQTEQIRRHLEHQARLEASVQHAAQLESLGVLAGGIAHDFNNILTIVMGNIGLALMNDTAAEEVGQQLKEAQRGASRASELTRQLLTFSKGGAPTRTAVSLEDLLRESVGTAVHRPDIVCRFVVEPGVRPAFVDRGQLGQVLRNLLINAIEAMPQGGNLVIGLANDDAPKGESVSLPDGHYVRVTLADQGEGISREILPRVFDPYFTTKKSGSGLGLTAAYSIIKKHEGAIDITSEKGRGTNVRFWVRAVEESPLIEPKPAPQLKGARDIQRTAKVLLMDDEPNIRLIGSIFLKRMGLEVVVAASGDEAVKAHASAQKEGKPFDLLILDLTVPGAMGGREAIEVIRNSDTCVRAIVSSGYSDDPVMAEHARFGFDACVPKPYELEQLATVIDHLLQRS